MNKKGSPLALSSSSKSLSLRDDSLTGAHSPPELYSADSKDGRESLKRTHNKRSSDVINHTKHLDEGMKENGLLEYRMIR
jgi:hypothetical protein